MRRRRRSLLHRPTLRAGSTARCCPSRSRAPQRYTELDARNAKPPARFEVKAPGNAPNVVIVLIDDVGFGGPSTFGGPIRTPTMDQVAAAGLRFNNFHTTALCSPTRNALKTGRNHHTVNTGSIMETSTAFPGNTGQNPNSVAPLAEMLRLNGYSTGAFGKWHETAAWETSVSGPFDRWPLHQGFDKFYGFIGGETDQWYPLIYDGAIKVDPPKMDNYHFTVDMTNQAINWVKAQQSMTPDKPFFVYYATGATHAPHHVPKEWADKYKGQFDKGWDQVRVETLERQKKLGIVPADTRLGERPKDLAAWDSLPADQRRLFARQAEVFAGFLEQTDAEIGRFRQSLADIGELDNTLFIYIAGDNGSSAEGGFVGMYNEMTYFNGVAEKVEDLIPLIDKWGGPDTFPHMAAGWAVAFDSPFSWTKQVASDFGGTRNGVAIQWPQGIKDKGGLRTQFSHVIDIAPTILEAAGLPEPKSVNGTVQTPIEGTSLVYAFNDAKAAERHTTQYFEMFGNRAIYNDGWFARTIHRAPWQTSGLQPLTSDVWELYDVKNDFSLTKNLAAEQGAKLKEMEALFMKEAEKYHVLPIDDRTIERTNPGARGPARRPGKPDLAHALRGHARDAGKHVHEHQEPVEQDHRGSGDPSHARERRHPVAGRTLWRVVAVHEGWQARIRVQLPRSGALHHYLVAGAAARSCHRHSRLRLRRRRCRQGRQGDAPRQRQTCRRRARREDTAEYLLGGRDGRRRHRQPDAGGSGNRHRRGHAIHRPDQQGHS